MPTTIFDTYRYMLRFYGGGGKKQTIYMQVKLSKGEEPKGLFKY